MTDSDDDERGAREEKTSERYLDEASEVRRREEIEKHNKVRRPHLRDYFVFRFPLYATSDEVVSARSPPRKY